MKFIMVAVLLFISGCTLSDVNYIDFPIPKESQRQVAHDLAWLIKEKHGAAAVFDFDYPQWGLAGQFGETLEAELRRLGIGVYAADLDKVGKTEHNKLYYTVSKINDQQFYVRVVVNGEFSLQRVWVTKRGVLFPLTSTMVFEGGYSER